jgi:hypothetical protein
MFTIVALDLFGLMVFLFFKLSVAPLFRLVVVRWSNNNRIGVDADDDDESSEQKKNVPIMKPQTQATEQASIQVQ